MIGTYTLAMLCEKYGIDVNKVIGKNNNILNYGEYNKIDYTLNYLINKLGIKPINVEKCPSILYKNVEQIKENVKFIKSQNIFFSNIETCLHVLSTESNELKNTYDYVLKNYGILAIEKITSILSVPVNIIKDVEKLDIKFINHTGNLSVAVGIKWGRTTLEEIQKMIQSPEYKEHPELFTSQTLTYATLEEIQKMLQSPEYQEHPELFTSETLAHATLEEIRKILQSPEYKEHPELFTSTTLAHATLEEIQKMLQSPEYQEHPELFTSETLAHATLEEIQKMLQSPEYQEHPELFTSTTLAHANLENIRELLKMDIWKDPKYKNLLTSSIVAKARQMIIKIPILLDIAKFYQIEEYLNTSFLLFSPSQNFALIKFLEENNMPLVVNNKLNPIFGKAPGLLKKKYNIDVKRLMTIYPFDDQLLKENEGKII